MGGAGVAHSLAPFPFSYYNRAERACQPDGGCILDCVEKVVRKIYGGKNPKAQN